MVQQRAMLCALHTLVLAELLVSGGSVNLRSIRHQQDQQFFAYDYSKHGQDWTAGACASRSRQSPIDLPQSASVTGTFAYKYNPIVEPFDFLNNGHALSAELAGLGYGGITYENAWYNLLNINIHSLSEHTWGGMQMPLELHLVHKRYDGDALLVVAIAVESPQLTGATIRAAALAAQQQALAAMGRRVFLQTNKSHSDRQVPAVPIPASKWYVEPPMNEPSFNPVLQAFLKLEPPPVNMKIRVPADSAHSYDINMLLQGANFYEYAGSLTAPPCAESVVWLVRQDSLQASDRQVLYLHDMIYKITAEFGNYRALMPLNGCGVGMRQGVMEDLPPTAAPPVPLPGKPQQSDREFRAMKWAMDAMTIAKSATDYVKDLDQRLRNAAQAHANALAPQLEPLKAHGQVGLNGSNEAIYQSQALPLNHEHVPTYQSPLQMQKTAETMARTLAAAAREEIEVATREVSQRSKEIAMQAAREAANMVIKGDGNLNALADGTPGQPAAGAQMQGGAVGAAGGPQGGGPPAQAGGARMQGGAVGGPPPGGAVR